MTYDALVESVRLIEGGLPASTPSRLSRRVRFLPLAVDVDGPTAATTFLRRGKGQAWMESHVLTKRQGIWRLEGGGGGTGGEAAAEDAPAVEELGGHLDVPGAGSVHVGTSISPSGFLHYVPMRAAAGVSAVLIDERAVHVPRHGQLVAVWAHPHVPHLVALDAGGQVLAEGPADSWAGVRPPAPPGARRLRELLHYTDPGV